MLNKTYIGKEVEIDSVVKTIESVTILKIIERYPLLKLTFKDCSVCTEYWDYNIGLLDEN